MVGFYRKILIKWVFILFVTKKDVLISQAKYEKRFYDFRHII